MELEITLKIEAPELVQAMENLAGNDHTRDVLLLCIHEWQDSCS